MYTKHDRNAVIQQNNYKNVISSTCHDVQIFHIYLLITRMDLEKRGRVMELTKYTAYQILTQITHKAEKKS